MSQFPFSGFPPAGLDFLFQLRLNNNREWFAAHKRDYIAYVRDPALALVVALGARLQELSPNLIVDTRTNGSGSLFRLARDARFSRDPTPYRTKIILSFWEGDGKKMECPGFAMEIEPEGGIQYVGVYGFTPALLAAYRRAVLDEKLGVELVTALQAVRQAGNYTIGGEHYKRAPRGYPADHPRADLLRHNTLFAASPTLSPAVITSPDLIEVCRAHFQNMSPIHYWLVKIAQGANS